jgi:hypothetical protein
VSRIARIFPPTVAAGLIPIMGPFGHRLPSLHLKDAILALASGGGAGAGRCLQSLINEAPAITEMRRRYPASALMHDPRNPEITTWLESLQASDRLATMHAMSIAFPMLQKSQDWKPRMAAVRGALKPNAEELANILIRAREISVADAGAWTL